MFLLFERLDHDKGATWDGAPVAGGHRMGLPGHWRRQLRLEPFGQLAGPDCPTAATCGHLHVRWHVLQYAYQGGGGGAYHVGWFNWKSFSSGYDTYYYTMMQWLIGASFTTSCTNQGTVWSCPLTEASGNMAPDCVGYCGQQPVHASVRVCRFQVLQRHLWRRNRSYISGTRNHSWSGANHI